MNSAGRLTRTLEEILNPGYRSNTRIPTSMAEYLKRVRTYGKDIEPTLLHSLV
jgi:hypothetical protein